MPGTGNLQFGVCGTDVGSGDVVGQYPAAGVTMPYAAVQVPTYGNVTVLVPNSTANLDFSQAANSQYIPLLIP